MIHAQIHRNSDGTIAELKLSVTADSLPNFTALVDRALNCWDSAPKELKDLGDMITHGRITQDHTYTKINTYQTSSELFSPDEQDAIAKWKEDHTEAEWMDLMDNNNIHSILK